MLLKKIFSLLIILIIFSTCKEEAVPLVFSEDNFTSEDLAIIDINIPKVEGSSDAGNKINTTIDTFVANAISLSEDSQENTSIKEAALKLNVEYQLFTDEFSENSQPWEAFVDGEVTHQSPEIISITLNTYLNTGGAHGNSIISFLNFNPESGDRYSVKDLINDSDGFAILAEKHFKNAIEDETDITYNSADNQFKFENLGFSEGGVILVFNQHELENYSLKMLEFTIPFQEANQYLTLN